MNIYTVLLMVHIVSGAVTLLAAGMAISSKLLKWQHGVHQSSGRVFSIAMSLIFVTALPMSLLKFNLFLLLVSLFSFYLMLMGWLYATDRIGSRARFLLMVSSAMLGISCCMVAYAVLGLTQSRGFAVPLLVFGLIGAVLAQVDWRLARGGGVKGKTRIAQHLSMMIGATIAAITAFLVNVVNLGGFLGIAMWLLPTLVLTPIIVWQRRRL